MENELVKNLRNGVAFAIGIVLVFGVLFGVYAFVEPINSPSSSNFEVGSNSWFDVLNNKIDDINSTVSNLTNSNPGNWDCISKSAYAGGSYQILDGIKFVSVSCDVGYNLIAGGCWSSGYTLLVNGPWNNNQWVCGIDSNAGGSNLYAYAWCCK